MPLIMRAMRKRNVFRSDVENLAAGIVVVQVFPRVRIGDALILPDRVDDSADDMGIGSAPIPDLFGVGVGKERALDAELGYLSLTSSRVRPAMRGTKTF
ncbi:MAG: hypothetical protein WDN09_04040 [bacterium]